MKITNVEVYVSSEYSDYALSCTTPGARYHIWLDRKTRQHVAASCSAAPVLYKNSIPNRGEPGYFSARRLRIDSQFATQLIAEMLSQAAAQQLFDKAEKRLADENAVENAKNKKVQEATLAQHAGPEMLKVLKAIKAFWDEGSDFPRELSPYALLLSDDEQLRHAVARVVKLAKEGPKV